MSQHLTDVEKLLREVQIRRQEVKPTEVEKLLQDVHAERGELFPSGTEEEGIKTSVNVEQILGKKEQAVEIEAPPPPLPRLAREEEEGAPLAAEQEEEIEIQKVKEREIPEEKASQISREEEKEMEEKKEEEMEEGQGGGLGVTSPSLPPSLSAAQATTANKSLEEQLIAEAEAGVEQAMAQQAAAAESTTAHRTRAIAEEMEDVAAAAGFRGEEAEKEARARGVSLVSPPAPPAEVTPQDPNAFAAEATAAKKEDEAALARIEAEAASREAGRKEEEAAAIRSAIKGGNGGGQEAFGAYYLEGKPFGSRESHPSTKG